MRRKWIISGAVAMVVMAIGAVVGLVPADVQAGTQCKSFGVCPHIRHFSPDAGYDKAIVGTCNWGWNKPWKAKTYIREGKRDKCVDLDGVFVRHNEEIWCKYSRQTKYGSSTWWEKRWDKKGWHQIHAWTKGDGHGCTVRRD